MNRSFVHLELNTDNIDKARSFYRDVFGWSFNDIPMGEQTYTQIELPQPPGGGIQVNPVDDAPSQWLPYVGVDNIPHTIDRARKAGAKVVEDYIAVPGYGALAIIMDPTGAPLGLWQPEGGFEGPGETSAQAPEPRAAEPRAKKTAAKKKAAKKTAAKKTAAKKTGGGAKKAAKKTGGGAKKAAKKKTGAGAKKAAKKKTGAGAKKAAKKTGGAAKKKTGGGAKKAAKKKTGGGAKKASRGAKKKAAKKTGGGKSTRGRRKR